MYTLHLISHTHWDLEWHLPFQKFRLKLVHLVDELLDLLQNDPGYLYFMLDGQTIVLEDYLVMRPERESELHNLIRSGRILIGPWYILPDEFLVSPEATIRNLLEGGRICRRFGGMMPVGYLPDTFSHIGQMPQILRGFGFDEACVWRGVPDMPCEFTWQSPDGSQVLTANLREEYNNGRGLVSSGLEGVPDNVREQRDRLAPHSLSGHLILMQGDDHMETVPATSQAIAITEGKLDGDVLVHSTLPRYFEAMRGVLDESKLPVLKGELRNSQRAPILPGVLSTRMWIKQRNRACETQLEKWAEPFSTWASLVGGSAKVLKTVRHPEDILHQAWRMLMECHPHDSICGCSIDAVHDEMKPRFDQVDQVVDEITRQSMEVLSTAVDTRPVPALVKEDRELLSALVAFNPTTRTRTDLVASIVDGIPTAKKLELVDEEGNLVPFEIHSLGSQQIAQFTLDQATFRLAMGSMSDGITGGMKVCEMSVLREGSTVYVTIVLSEMGEVNRVDWENGMRMIDEYYKDAGVTAYSATARFPEKAQVIFPAAAVPGHGYRTFWVRAVEKDSPATVSSVEQTDPSPGWIENEFLRVKVQEDATLDVFDKTTGLHFCGQNRLVDGGDHGDEYNYSAPQNDELVNAKLMGTRIDKSAARQVLELNLVMDVPEELTGEREARSARRVSMPVTSRITLTAGVPRVDIQTEVDNRARDHRLRVHFSAPFSTQSALYDGHFEIVERSISVTGGGPEWDEQPYPQVPQRAFCTVTDGKTGLLIANRGLPEAEALKREDDSAEIAVTLLRSVGWLSRDDMAERNGGAGPGVETPGAQVPGKWVFDYAIVPYQGDEKFAAYAQAYAFEAPLQAMAATLHAASLPVKGSFLQVEPEQFMISAVKTAEDRRGWVVRGCNLGSDEIKVSLKSLLPISNAEKVNMAEETLEEFNPGAELVVKGNQVVSILLS